MADMRSVLHGRTLVIELKSVINPATWIAMFVSPVYICAEDGVQRRVKAAISRGKVDVYVNIENNTEEAVSVTLNQPVAAGYMEALRTMADTFGLESNISIDLLAKFPDVFKVDKVPEDLEELTADIHAVTEEALRDFDAMRSREGEKLEADLLGRLVTLENFTHQVEQRSPQTVADYRARLTAKLQEVLADRQLDESGADGSGHLCRQGSGGRGDGAPAVISPSSEKMLAGGSPIGPEAGLLDQEMNERPTPLVPNCNNLGSPPL